MLSPTDLRTPQGLQPEKPYHGTVIENDDGKTKRRRIRIRVDGIFDGIPDDKLPWAMAMDGQPDGASETSGHSSVPKKGTKVMVQFQGGNPLFPKYSTNYITEDTNVLQDANRNYPDRRVDRLQNKAEVVVDTKTNEIFLRNPGDAHIYVEGNVHMEVKGNIVEKFHGNVDRWIKGNLQETVVGNRITSIEGKDVEIIKGSRHLRVESDSTQHIQGNAAMHYEKDYSLSIDGLRDTHVVKNDSLLIDGDADYNFLGASTWLRQKAAIDRFMEDHSEITKGNRDVIIDGSNVESVKGRYELYVEGSTLMKTLNDLALITEGKLTFGAKGNFELRTPADFKMEVDGSLNQVIKGALVALLGSEDRTVEGNRTVLVGGTHLMTPAAEI